MSSDNLPTGGTGGTRPATAQCCSSERRADRKAEDAFIKRGLDLITRVEDLLVEAQRPGATEASLAALGKIAKGLSQDGREHGYELVVSLSASVRRLFQARPPVDDDAVNLTKAHFGAILAVLQCRNFGIGDHMTHRLIVRLTDSVDKHIADKSG